MSAVTITADGYIIKVKNRIGISRTYHVTGADIIVEPALAAVGEGGDVNSSPTASTPRTKGLDFVGTWRGHALDGALNMTLAYNTTSRRSPSSTPA